MTRLRPSSLFALLLSLSSTSACRLGDVALGGEAGAFAGGGSSEPSETGGHASAAGGSAGDVSSGNAGTTPVVGATGGAQSGATGGSAHSTGGSVGVPGEPNIDECVAVIDVSECCAPTFAVTREAFDADPCLVSAVVGARQPYQESCYNPACETANCASVADLPHVAALDAEGECVLVDDCAADEDCINAFDIRASCNGRNAAPVAMKDSCAEAGGRFCADCSLLDCAWDCDYPLPVQCVQGSAGYRVCQSKPRSCEQWEQSAAAFAERVSYSCSADTDCTVGDFGVPCVGPFACSVPISGDFDVSCVGPFACSVAMSKDALQMAWPVGYIVESYESAGCGCAPITCRDPAELTAVCDAGRCVLE